MLSKWLSPVFYLGFSLALMAQQSARLLVLVTDASNAAVPDATVRVAEVSRNEWRLAKPDLKGGYLLEGLNAGQHRLEIVKTGFSTYVIENLRLHPRDSQQIQITLETASAAKQVVTVHDEVEGLDQASSPSAVVSGAYANTIPVNDRSVDGLIQLAPGATQTGNGPAGGLHVNGQRSNTNYYTLDGVSANTGSVGGFGPGGPTAGSGSSISQTASGVNNLISLDGLQEFRVQTSAFAPEYGRTPGGQITMVSRSGSTEFHGSAFDYFRPGSLHANDWFANRYSLGRAHSKLSDFGATLGGPLRRSTFFFLSYEGSPIEQAHYEIDAVPNAASRKSAASGLRPYLNAFPQPNGRDLTGDAAQFLASYSTPSRSDQASIRLDKTLNDRKSVFLRYSVAPSDSASRGGINSSANSVTHVTSNNQTLTGAYTWIDRDQNVNNFRLNLTRTSQRLTSALDTFGGAQTLSDSLLFPSGYDSKNGSFALNVTGVGGYNVGRTLDSTQNQLNAVFDQTVSSRGTQAKAGFDFRILTPTSKNKPYSQTITFNGLDGDTDSLLSGTAATAITTASVAATYPEYINFSFYLQDTVRVDNDQTVTFGLRWDVNPPPRARRGQHLLGLDDSYGLSSSKPLYKTRWTNVAPRFGFSNQLNARRNYETILRGGIGLFYDPGYGTSNAAFNSAPYTSSTITQEPSFPLASSAITVPSLPPSKPYGLASAADPGLKSPLIWQWNMSLEQRLGTGQALNAAYAGSAGSDLLRQSSFPGFFSTDYDLLQLASNGGSSRYQSLQTSYRRTLGRTMQAQVAYTISHSIDTESNDAGMAGFALISTNRRSNSDFDIRHNLYASGTFRFPSVGLKYLRSATKNWNIDWLVSARSALPLNVTGLTQTSGDSSAGKGFFFAQVRPDYTGAPLWIYSQSAPGGKFLNRAAFADAASGTEGSLPRNAIRGFGQTQVDFSVHRDLAVSEKMRLQFRADAFNLLNHPNFSDPNALEGANLASSDFGVSSRMSYNSGFGGTAQSSGAPRSLQFSVRAQF